MDEFGNYPREKFDPFSLMLFKGLQVVAFLFFLALLAMNPEAKEGKVESKAEFIIWMSWPDDHPDDIDLYAEDPLGNIVWYHVREGGFMMLDRDDRGSANNTITVDGRKITSSFRQEIACADGGLKHFDLRWSTDAALTVILATKGGPIPIVVKTEKINPTVETVSYDQIKLERMGEEKTAVRFKLAANGNVIDVNHRPKSLLQLTRSVRRGGEK